MEGWIEEWKWRMDGRIYQWINQWVDITGIDWCEEMSLCLELIYSSEFYYYLNLTKTDE